MKKTPVSFILFSASLILVVAVDHKRRSMNSEGCLRLDDFFAIRNLPARGLPGVPDIPLPFVLMLLDRNAYKRICRLELRVGGVALPFRPKH